MTTEKSAEIESIDERLSMDERFNNEMLDSFDEELEMELDDERMEQILAEFAGATHIDGLQSARSQSTLSDRQTYFKELFRLQGELVKLQDWVVRNKLKVVVLFEGRDAAGKGGVIKRVTQRLNPRVCRVAALPAHSGIFSAIFRTYRQAAKLCCLTAAGITVPGSKKSWAFVTTTNMKSFSARCRSLKRCWYVPALF